MADLRWLDDMDPFGAETESSLEELEQDIYHIILQDQGTNLDDPNRGLGVGNILSAPIDKGLAMKAQAMIQDDDRVNRCTAVVSQIIQDGITSLGTLDLEIVPNEDLLQTLDLSVPIGGSKEPAA